MSLDDAICASVMWRVLPVLVDVSSGDDMAPLLPVLEVSTSISLAFPQWDVVSGVSELKSKSQ
jgi:hypothetical protein